MLFQDKEPIHAIYDIVSYCVIGIPSKYSLSESNYYLFIFQLWSIYFCWIKILIINFLLVSLSRGRTQRALKSSLSNHFLLVQCFLQQYVQCCTHALLTTASGRTKLQAIKNWTVRRPGNEASVSVPTTQMLWLQCWKRIHAVGTDTWVTFTIASHKLFYKHHILWISVRRTVMQL